MTSTGLSGPVRPPFSYYGGKNTIAARIVAVLPAHGHYVEAFAGSLAVLLAKPPSGMETINDLDENIVRFWRVLRDRPDDLTRACALTPHSRAEHAASLDLTAVDDLEAARRVWVRLTQGRSGSMRPTGWRTYQDPAGSSTSMPGYLAGYTYRIPPAARRLAGVSLECRPAIDVIETYGKHPDVLIYADPPYLYGTRTGGAHYRHEMGRQEQHQELADALLACRSAVVLSGYAHPLYDGLYADWDRMEIPTFTGNGGDRRQGGRVEVLWSNRPLTRQDTLDFDGATA
jgi:DNA adenine methylase